MHALGVIASVAAIGMFLRCSVWKLAELFGDLSDRGMIAVHAVTGRIPRRVRAAASMDLAWQAPPAIRAAALTQARQRRGGLKTLAAAFLLGLASMAASVSSALAVCDGPVVNSTTGATITFTSIGQVYHLCLTVIAPGNAHTGDDAVVFGLYSVSGIDASVNFPITPSTVGLNDYAPTTTKARYTFSPLSTNDNGATSTFGHAQINIKLEDVTTYAQDSVTLYYAANCSDALGNCSGDAHANTPWTFTINLPTPPAPVATSTTTMAASVGYNSSGNSITVSGNISGTTTGYSVVSTTTSGGGSVSIDNSGVATYAPKTGYRGNDTFQYFATNTGSNSATVTVTVPVGNPTFSASVPTNTGTAGTAYSQQVTITGGRSPYSNFSATGLPAGLSISASGLITGTPTAPCTCSSVVVTVTDSSVTGANGGTASPFTAGATAFTITIAPAPAPTANSTSTTASSVGYNSAGNTITVSGNISGATTGYSVVSSTTSGGGTVSINASGVATYTPKTGYRGNDTFQYFATNAGSNSATVTVTVPVGNPTFTASVTTNTGTVGTAYSQQVTITGGQSPYSGFSATGLPAGLSISASGLITGTPTTPCTCSSVVVTVTDSSVTGANGGTASPFTSTAAAFTLTINAAPTPTATDFTYGTTIGYDSAGNIFSIAAAVTGPTTGYSVGSATTAGGGAVAIDAAGTVTYSPKTGYRGNDSFSYTATNSGSNSASKIVTVAVGNPTFTASVTTNTGTVGTAYSQQVTISGGKAPYSSVSATGLPAGLSISASGLITGTPTTPCTCSSVIVTATDSSVTGANGGTASPFTSSAAAFTLTINAAPTPTATDFTYGTAIVYNSSANVFSIAAAVTGPTTGYSVGSPTTAGGGAVAINASGTVTYTPKTGYRGNDSFSYTATNSGSDSGSKIVTVTVANPTFTASVTNNTGTVGTAYSQQVTIAGGKAPYSSYSATGLPAGLSISASGLITGTPSATCTCSVVVTVTDSSVTGANGGTASPFTAPAAAFALTISNIPLPAVTGVNPNTGSTAGGTSVAVTGTNFTGATAVKFGTSNAASFVVASATSIVATSPAGSAGTVDITVTTPGGTSPTGAADKFTYAAPGHLIVSPATDMVASGKVGGPFSPATFQYQISASSGTIGYTISGAPSWLDVAPSSGNVTTAGTTVTFTVNVTANSLARGSYGPITITFTNSDDGAGTQSRTASLRVGRSVAHDFDGDGKSDILWRDTTGNTQIWLMNGAAVAANLSLGNVSLAPGWTVVGQRDFNGDGKSELLWADAANNLAIWVMNGGAVTMAAAVGNVPPSWAVNGTGDFNGDGKGNILWRDGAGNAASWRMDGTTLISVAGLGKIETVWSIVGTGDFDGDGRSDIVWREAGGDVAIWLMNGNTISSVVNLGNVPAHWAVVGTGDLDGDGKADIVWRDRAGNVAVWFMNGGAILKAVSVSIVPTNWTFAETGDFDGDGKADLLWRDTAGNVAIWFMNGSAVVSVASLGNVPTNWTIQTRNAN